MDPHLKDFIIKNKPELMELTKCNPILWSTLESEKVLGPCDVEDIRALRDYPIQQSSHLYDVLPGRGNHAYDALIAILKRLNQHSAAKKLEEGRELGSTSSRALEATAGLVSNPVDDLKYVTTLLPEYTKLVQQNSPFPVTVELPDIDMRTRFQGKDFYDLPYEGKGLALLVNIYLFDDKDMNRKGAEHDSIYMKNLWKQLGYYIFNEWEIDQKQGKWYKQDVLDMIGEFKKACQRTKPESIIVYIGSHGFYNKIVTSKTPKVIVDETSFQTINLHEEIMQQFYHYNCPELKGKPKIFFLSACQDFETKNCHGDSSTGLGMGVSDLLVFTAQAPGLNAYRNPDHGSWLAHCLTFATMRLTKEKSLLEILKIVGQTLEKLKEKDILPKEQIPEIRDIGMKELYFFMEGK